MFGSYGLEKYMWEKPYLKEISTAFKIQFEFKDTSLQA